jgi:hypothetical protein
MKNIKNFRSFNESINESIALEYLEEIYDRGGLSSDAYDMVRMEDEDYLKEFDKIGDEYEIRKKVLKYLDTVGAISSDVYDIEMENL